MRRRRRTRHSFRKIVLCEQRFRCVYVSAGKSVCGGILISENSGRKKKRPSLTMDDKQKSIYRRKSQCTRRVNSRF